jgi:hypothetical protein
VGSGHVSNHEMRRDEREERNGRDVLRGRKHLLPLEK